MSYERQILAESGNDHLAGWAAESQACELDDFARWIDRVEQLLGVDVDGDEAIDGFSLDGFDDMWEAGRTPEQAVAAVGGRRVAAAVPRPARGEAGDGRRT
ncbi:hypothetical protein MUG78_16890 [Gordonia alkaliphila]|uniref:hypothetical protein n=1 Tax=Gordonia alkaliphila TaxID=1053547 RepID=UPI001FF446E0|nr:hypothetical protein [Gordonia alkaliphila]MCK0441078.1 hypothetical protein [Gordonia alkaliphila]